MFHSSHVPSFFLLKVESGILFIDKAQPLIPSQKYDDEDDEFESLEEIMTVMGSGSIVVIFVGYVKPMKCVTQ